MEIYNVLYIYMSSKKLYQNVNVKKNHKKGNQNINSINIILNPDTQEEMYKQGASQRPSSNDSVFNLYNQASEPVNPYNMAQILGKANREELTTTAQEVQQANTEVQANNVINAMNEGITKEMSEEQLEAQSI